MWARISGKELIYAFGVWSKPTIRRAISWLAANHLLESGNYNQQTYDNTLWYRVDVEALDAYMAMWAEFGSPSKGSSSQDYAGFLDAWKADPCRKVTQEIGPLVENQPDYGSESDPTIPTTTKEDKLHMPTVVGRGSWASPYLQDGALVEIEQEEEIALKGGELTSRVMYQWLQGLAVWKHPNKKEKGLLTSAIVFHDEYGEVTKHPCPLDLRWGSRPPMQFSTSPMPTTARPGRSHYSFGTPTTP